MAQATEGQRWLTLSTTDAASEPTLRLPRLLYYLGMSFMAEDIIRPVAGLTLSDIAFFAALLALLLAPGAVRGEGHLLLPPLLAYGVAVFLLGGIAGSLDSRHMVASLGTVVRFMYLTLVWFWLGTIVLRSQGQVATAVSLWTISAAISGSAAAGQLFLGDLFPVPASSFNGRSAGLIVHPNNLGAVEAVALVPAIMIMSRPGGRLRHRLTGTAVLVGMLTGLILSGSVGALVAAAAGVACWIVLSRVSRGYLMGYLALGLGIFVVVGIWLASQQGADAYSAPSRIAAVTGYGDPTAFTLKSRLDIDRDAFRVILQRPLIGVGLDADSPAEAVPEEVAAHNMLLLAWIGGGLPAMLGILIVITSLAMLSRSALRQSTSERERMTVAALAASILGFAITGMGEPVLYVRWGWVPAALLIAVRSIQQRELLRGSG